MKSEGGLVFAIGKNKKIIFFLKMWLYGWRFSLIANLSGLSICQCQYVSVNMSGQYVSVNMSVGSYMKSNEVQR